jgi:hypothetical protein
MLSAYKRHTDLEGLAFLRQSLVCVALRVAAAIEDPDRVGLQLDDKLLNHVIDGLLADRHFDCAVILASGQFALDEYERALDKAFGDRLAAFPVSNDVVLLRSIFLRLARPSRTSWWRRRI